MPEVLPIAEIIRLYPQQWVLLGDVVATDGPDVRAGRVLYHGPDKAELHRTATEVRRDSRELLAIAHTGELAGDAADWW